LAGVELARASTMACEDSLAELAALAKGVGVEVVGQVTQRLKEIDPRTFIGRGKVAELARMARERGATLAVFDDSLSPVQARNLERELKLKLIDRSQLILDIFARRARSSEGKIQVEMAQLSYLQARLARQWSHLSRLSTGGGLSGHVGARGPGETQLEVDRRRVRQRLTRLAAKLRSVERSRALQRQRRQEGSYPVVALVGYTNAGKSSVMKALTKAAVETADRPFSTLDPTVRRLRLPDGLQVMLADTVGFIHRLPHPLIEAFKATLEEVRSASLLLHVVDLSSSLRSEQIEVVDRVLNEIGAEHIPRLLVKNKADLVDCAWLKDEANDGVVVSAITGQGLDQLRARISKFFANLQQEVTVTLPVARADLMAIAHRNGRVLNLEYQNGMVSMRAMVTPTAAAVLRRAAIKAP
jgi:GTP-binding protein HflX